MLQDSLKNNDDWGDNAMLVLQSQSICCSDGGIYYFPNMKKAIYWIYTIMYPIVSLFGWIVFLLALWVKKRAGSKDLASAAVDQDIQQEAPATQEAQQEAPAAIIDSKAATLPNDLEAQPPVEKKVAKKEPIFYFTNIKIFLTCLVVFVHCHAMLLDQNYD